eukprot:COSAG02_NODE_7256_length_3094_cov_19.263773_1_plen_39_part_10
MYVSRIYILKHWSFTLLDLVHETHRAGYLGCGQKLIRNR